MVEIAICLAIIGIALVAIIGVLPIGINVQKDNREETLIDQDATIFIENIRNGTRGLDDLTNYVYAITNSWTFYNDQGKSNGGGVNGYGYAGFFVDPKYPTAGTPSAGSPITNGLRIIGLLSTPEFIWTNGTPLGNISIVNVGYYSNYVVAYVHSLSGPASEKPPQDNDLIRNDSFGYKIVCQNVPAAVDTNVYNLSPDQQVYARQLAANLRELRLTFLWPLLPGGGTGNGRQTFRTAVAGQMVTNIVGAGQFLYFFQPQSFTKAP
jgi:type II secretory pathway pseudopilin PulG